ncbi:MAG TPA: POTRA domain-containing protein [Vicinamibacterales bacterium]|nr:POTRA domain-containing protein [Vicinamibacterales bacterium]
MAFGLLAAPWAGAQGPSPASTAAPVVDEIRAEREGRPVNDPAITGLIETATGQPLSMRQVRESIAHLVNLNLFDDVQVRSEPSGRGGVRLTYRLMPAHPVDRVEFRGMLGLAENDLRRAVEDRFGEIPRAAQVDNVVTLLRTLYRERGYPTATITGQIVQSHEPDRATLVMNVQAGARPSIVDVQLTQLDAEEQGLLEDRPALRTGVPYDRAAVERELQRWTDRMHGRNYYEARASHGVLFPPDGAVLSVSVTRGPRVTVAFTGDSLTENERERLVPIRAEASADEDLLEDSARAIELYLRGRGYRQARATYTRTPGPRDVTITFDVRRGPHFVFGTVEVTGATSMTPAEVREFLLVKDGEPFTENALGAGVARLRDAYLVRGHALVKVEPVESVAAPGGSGGSGGGDGHVNVAVRVTEGPRTAVRTVAFQGQMALAEETLRGLVVLAPGRAFSESELAADRDRIDLEYRNRGYDQVAVRSEVTLAEKDSQADVRYQITEGPQVLVDRVIIVGNTRTKPETIERELLVKPGQPLGYSALIESRVRLGALGLFRRVNIEQLAHASEPRRDIFVRVEEAKATNIGFGPGVEGSFTVRSDAEGEAVEQFEFAPRAFFQIGRNNLGGKNRSVNLFTRVSLRSRDVVVNSSGVRLKDDRFGFNEYRVVGTFKEPRVFDTRADLLVTGILEQAMRSSFNFLRRETRAEAGLRLSRLYSASGRYSLQRTEIFDEQITDPAQKPLIDRLFPEVRLSTFAGSILRDSRDDVLDSAKGTLMVLDADLSARAIGSEVGFVKAYVQGRKFIQLPTERRTVVALGARLGAAHGFPREVPRVDDGGEPVFGEDGRQPVDVVQDLPASERFFAGGDTTVRGFALDRLGDDSTISDTGFPTGGNGVVVLNAELRVAVTRRIQAAGFMDSGNVWARASDIDLSELRAAPGFGIRIATPVGPIRLDLGFKLDRRELSPGRLERRSIWHISLGQAF